MNEITADNSGIANTSSTDGQLDLAVGIQTNEIVEWLNKLNPKYGEWYGPAFIEYGADSMYEMCAWEVEDQEDLLDILKKVTWDLKGRKE
jgi:hypothetical protein